MNSRNTIGYRIMLVNVILSAVFLIIGVFSVLMIRNAYVSRVEKEAINRMAYSVEQNMLAYLSQGNACSLLVLSDPLIQELLKTRTGYSNLFLVKETLTSLNRILVSFSYIYSIVLIDLDGNTYKVLSREGERIRKKIDYAEPGFASVMEAKGLPLYRDVRGFLFTAEGEPLPACLRAVNDLNTQMPIGMVSVVFKPEIFVEGFGRNLEDDKTMVAFFDEKHDFILGNPLLSDIPELLFQNEDIFSVGGSEIVLDNHNRWIVKGSIIEIPSWYSFILMSRESLALHGWIQIILFSGFSLLLFALVAFFFGSIYIRQKVYPPIASILNAMSNAENGNLLPVAVDSNFQEFIRLQEGYNLMINNIQILMNKVEEREKRIRESELEALQAQMNPHFLYNTLDSLSSLIISGNSKVADSLLTKLARYYQLAVSYGSMTVTIETEIGITRNYLDIVSIRYEHSFTFSSDIDDQSLQLEIPKLTIQPLVENALNHGLKPKDMKGHVSLTISTDEDYCIVSIKDDGVGMNPDVRKQLHDDTCEGNVGLGLRGTLSRLSFFYGEKFYWELYSDSSGTEIILNLPSGTRV